MVYGIWYMVYGIINPNFKTQQNKIISKRTNKKIKTECVSQSHCQPLRLTETASQQVQKQFQLRSTSSSRVRRFQQVAR